MKLSKTCQSCGSTLTPDAPAGLCPQCLLKTEIPTLSDGITPTQGQPSRTAPIPGQTFGPYRILRLLGQGGMGEVYEAEHIETGRRLALKVMSRALASDQDRKRFLREGRLAASVNHPNVVYIHGSEEIGGVPVIAMELVDGGTLKDSLKREGPLPAARAVEAALQILDGLEAAQSAGVLHRDIKPANCFVDADGTVKVGDFGLSVSTLARGESLLTASGSALGTPAYASPEQLRGEELDVRSDIYSVGATLYHLLTGRTPFGATDFVKLITEVLDKEPQAPTALRPNIPFGLSRLVLRCLAEDRKNRFQSYAELREALLPFRATEAVPARPAMRFLAGLLDDLIAYGPSLLYLVYWSFDPLDSFTRERTLTTALVWLPFALWYLLYYAIPEGRWGATLGKNICGLAVVGRDRQPPGLTCALLRALIYLAPATLPGLFLMAFVPLSKMHDQLAHGEVLPTDWLWLPLFLLLFVTMRRRNGYATVHDLLSGTRVIVRPKTTPRPALSEGARRTPASETSPPVLASESGGAKLPDKLGPYEIQACLWKRRDALLLHAFDPALRRNIWIHVQPVTAESVPAARRDLNRPGRLRWLNGGRTETEQWDAYQAAEGAPFLALGNASQPWRAVRFWLLDLAEEMAAALQDHSQTLPLTLDRLWIASNGRALLLDFSCPTLPADASLSPAMTLTGLDIMQRFLDLVASRALHCQREARAVSTPATTVTPVPLHAQTFLGSLARGTFEQPGFIVGNLQSLITKPAEITRAWRTASLALAPALILGVALILAGMVNFERIRWQRHWAALHPGKPSLSAATQAYSHAVDNAAKGEGAANEAELVRAYLVNHFATLLTNDTFWADKDLAERFPEPQRSLLRSAVTAHNPLTAEAVQEAERVVPRLLHQHDKQERSATGWVFIGMLIAGAAGMSLIELAGIAFFRQSPMFRLLGIAVVDECGQSATRWRLLWRWMLIWLPVSAIGFVVSGFAALALAAPLLDFLDAVTTKSLTDAAASMILAFCGLLLGTMIYAALHPARGLQDRFAGTWLVPR